MTQLLHSSLTDWVKKQILETSADGTMLTVTEGCNVRAEANSDSEIIGGLDEGDQVQKMGQEGDWIQIEYDGQTGYVYSGLLQ